MTLDTFRDPYQPHSPMRTGNGNGNSTDSMSPPPPPPRVELVGRYADCPRVLCSDIASQLRLKLPPLQRLSRRWSLLYSLDQHGISFATMLRRVANKGPIILVIQDEEDQIFGGYATESFKPHIGSYGSGECFLWKLHKDTPNDKGQLIVYPWSGKNDYSIMTETDYLAMGADNGKFGIWLDSNFDNGSSMPCATFDNPTLSTHESFTCAHLEIWALQ